MAYRFDDEVKDVAHGAFTPEMMKLPQATWIETFLEGVTDKSTGLPVFKELVWFTYKVSGVMCDPMCSASEGEHCWSIEGWIHSQRRNKVNQKLVEKIVRAHLHLHCPPLIYGAKSVCPEYRSLLTLHNHFRCKAVEETGCLVTRDIYYQIYI